MTCWRKPIIAGLALLAISSGAYAAESARGVYLLGLKGGPGAAITPPPGIYFADQNYYYHGDINQTVVLNNGQVASSAEATGLAALLSAQWVSGFDILGGDLAFTFLQPVGYLDVDAIAGGMPTGDSDFGLGDPVVGAYLGWHFGEFHLQSGFSVWLPIAPYTTGAIANIANHRLAADVFSSLTWFEPETGIDISNTIGFTFNTENETNNYRTGTEFHWEGSISKKLSPNFTAGVTGYYYNQLTSDGGAGKPAILGSFKGEVAAIGALVGYNFTAGNIPVSTELRYYHEFAAKNRLEGDAVFFAFSMPLWIAP